MRKVNSAVKQNHTAANHGHADKVEGLQGFTEKYNCHPALEGLYTLNPPEGEEYAADTLTIGDTVLMAQGYDETQRLVRDEGFNVIYLDVSEIEKCNGALTCLSILF